MYDDGSGLSGNVSDGFGVLLIELLDEFFRVYISRWFPAVMCFGKTFPPDQVLDLTLVLSDMQDLFDLPFQLSINEFWCRFLALSSI